MEEKNYEMCVGQIGTCEPVKANQTMKDIVSELSARTTGLLSGIRKYSSLLFGKVIPNNVEEQKFLCMQDELEFIKDNLVQTQVELDCMFNLFGVGR